MATALNIVRRALRVAHAIDADESPEAEATEDALDILNGLLAEWHEAEIGLPEYVLATINTTTVLDAADREAVALQLALRIAGEYGTQVSPLDMQSASDSFARLRLRYFQPRAVATDLPSPRVGFNIETG
jgi:hypothetical protein